MAIPPQGCLQVLARAAHGEKRTKGRRVAARTSNVPFTTCATSSDQAPTVVQPSCGRPVLAAVAAKSAAAASPAAISRDDEDRKGPLQRTVSKDAGEVVRLGLGEPRRASIMHGTSGIAGGDGARAPLMLCWKGSNRPAHISARANPPNR